MKKSFSLRKQLTLLMAVLVVLQSVSLIMALLLSRVFYLLDAESFRMFHNATRTRMITFNESAGKLVGSVTEEARIFNEVILELTEQNHTIASMIYQDDEVYYQTAEAGSRSLIRLINNNDITGAFLILNRSNADKASENAHSVIYIRDPAPVNRAGEISSYQLELGPIGVSQQYKMGTGINWDLDMKFQEGKQQDYPFYYRPLEAGAEYPDLEFEYLGCWTAPTAILKDNQPVICYTVPLFDEQEQVYGVLGIEILLQHFTESYLPNTDLPYPNSFYAIAPVEDDVLSRDWLIPSGPLAQVYLQGKEALQLETVSGMNLYQMKLVGLGDMYCSVQPLKMYSASSPFAEEPWSLVGVVPQSVLGESSREVRFMLIASIAVTTVISFLAIFFLAYVSTWKISGLSAYVKGLSPGGDIKFIRTGLKEVDDLTSAVEVLSHRVINAFHNTEKVIELTRLPLGVFEVSDAAKEVSLSKYVYVVLQLEPGQKVLRQEWAAMYKELTACQEPEYEGIYHYREQWLRILEAPTNMGSVGILFDVTEDVEKHHRLQRELDFDALTLLYNRKSFKRKVQNIIQRNPERLGAMVFSDLDNLKYINDTYGHDMGDRLIVRAGEMYRTFNKYGGIVARISGDEFAVYLHGYTSKEEIREIIDGQFKANENYKLETSDLTAHRIRASSGIAWYPQDSDNATDLLKLADFAMYQSKKREKGSIHEFDSKTYQETSYLLENREVINRLLDEQLIRFAFQPIVDLHSGEVYAYEALMRPLLDNFKSPLEVLRVAEDQSKLAQLERVVLMTAFQLMADHMDEIGDKKIFINSIANQSVSKEDSLYIRRQYASLFKNVVIEITEAESNYAGVLDDKISFIRGCQMMLAIDDYGSGYSNDLRVLSMNPDIIKIDMEMIQGIHNNYDKQKLVGNLVSFCKPKQIRLVAEGVETVEDLYELIRLDVDLVQGYYIGKPAFAFSSIADDVIEMIGKLNQEIRCRY